MVRNDGRRRTIFWLIVLLGIVIWFELVMVVKFFTKEFLEYTMEEDARAQAFYNGVILANESSLSDIETELPLRVEVVREDRDSAEKATDVAVVSETNNDIAVQPSFQVSTKNMNQPTIQPVIEQSVSSRATTRTAEERVDTGSCEVQTEVQISDVPAIYKGYSTAGRIEIPKTGVDIPILDKQTAGGMEIAACLLYSTGSLNYGGKNLIVGHNYRNGKLFSNNNGLQVGDRFYITSLDGKRVEYVIYNKIITNPEDVSYLMGATSEIEVFLSSCTDDNVNRIVIMARAM